MSENRVESAEGQDGQVKDLAFYRKDLAKFVSREMAGVRAGLANIIGKEDATVCSLDALAVSLIALSAAEFHFPKPVCNNAMDALRVKVHTLISEDLKAELDRQLTSAETN